MYDGVRTSRARKIVVFAQGAGIDIDRRITEDTENYFTVNTGIYIRPARF